MQLELRRIVIDERSILAVRLIEGASTNMLGSGTPATSRFIWPSVDASSNVEPAGRLLSATGGRGPGRQARVESAGGWVGKAGATVVADQRCADATFSAACASGASLNASEPVRPAAIDTVFSWLTGFPSRTSSMRT